MHGLSDDKPITKAAYRLDITGLGGVIFDLLAQAVDVDHDGIFIDDGLAPDQIIKHILGKDTVDIVEKQFHHGVFSRRQRDLAVIFIKVQRAGIVGKGAGSDQLAGSGQIVAAAADQRLDFSTECNGIEWLGDIVIGTDVETVEGIDILFAAADDHNRRLNSLFADDLDSLKAIDARHVDIHQDQIIALDIQQGKGILAAVGHLGMQAAAFQCLVQHSRYGLVVIDNQNDIFHKKRLRFSIRAFIGFKYTHSGREMQGAMQMKKKNQKKYNTIIIVILLLTLLGIGLILQTYQNYRAAFIEIQDAKQLQLAKAIDRNIGALLEQCDDGLTYVLYQEGFADAEQQWIESGDSSRLRALFDKSYLVRSGTAADILVIEGDRILWSLQGKNDYHFLGDWDEHHRQRICEEDEEGTYLALTASDAQGTGYAALVDIEKFYRLAGSEELAEADQLLLLDRTHSVMLHYCTHEETVKTTLLEDCPKREDFRLLLEADEQNEQGCYAFIYQTQRMDDGYNAHIVTLPSGENSNRSFAVGLIGNIDQALAPLREASVRWVLGGMVVLLGISLMLSLMLHYRRRDARIARELELLRQKNLSMEELNRKTREMAHHQRLEMIGTLASGIAHEFNNLLTPIMGYSMLTLEQLPPEREDLYDNILEIYNTSRKAREITSQLSQYVRKAGNEKKELLQPDRLIEKVMHVAMPACPEGVSVEKSFDCEPYRIYGNETQLLQLLLNLMINGFHAMGEAGGTLTLSAEARQGKVVIAVADTGSGIPESVLPHVFEPFFTTKEGGQGTGLGLAIAQQIAHEHQGYIEVRSQVGEGSRFYVSLPAYREGVGGKA